MQRAPAAARAATRGRRARGRGRGHSNHGFPAARNPDTRRATRAGDFGVASIGDTKGIHRKGSARSALRGISSMLGQVFRSLHGVRQQKGARRARAPRRGGDQHHARRRRVLLVLLRCGGSAPAAGRHPARREVMHIGRRVKRAGEFRVVSIGITIKRTCTGNTAREARRGGFQACWARCGDPILRRQAALAVCPPSSPERPQARGNGKHPPNRNGIPSQSAAEFGKGLWSGRNGW